VGELTDKYRKECIFTSIVAKRFYLIIVGSSQVYCYILAFRTTWLSSGCFLCYTKYLKYSVSSGWLTYNLVTALPVSWQNDGVSGCSNPHVCTIVDSYQSEKVLTSPGQHFCMLL